MPKKDMAGDNEKLIELVEKAKNGEKIAFNLIVKRIKGFLNYIAYKKFFIPGYTQDDILQECLIALYQKAIKDYKKDKGPFVRFAKLCIRRHIITELKTRNKHKYRALNEAVSLDMVVEEEDGGNQISLYNYLASTNDNLFEKTIVREKSRELYLQLARKCTALEYKILVYYIKGYNYNEIVNLVSREEKDINKKVVDNALVRVKNKAEELMSAIENDGMIQKDMFEEIQDYPDLEVEVDDDEEE